MLKATFISDFSNFTDAVKKAEADFKGLEVGAQKVEKALNRTVDAFSGRKIVQDANLVTEAIGRIGGASQLTEREQASVNRTLTEAIAKYKALGQEAPQAMRNLEAATRKVDDVTGKMAAKTADWTNQIRSLGAAVGVSLSIGAVVSFGREILKMGDDIQRTADRTGLMTGEVQKLSFIADQSGNTIEELTSAVGQMQNRLASGDSSAVGALKQLNVTFEELASLGPYQQLERISEAVALIPNPATRAQVAMDLFGKSGIAVLPTLTSEFKKLGEAAPVMSDKTVKALDEAGDALNKFKLTAKVWAAESYNYLVKSFTDGIAAIYEYIASLYESVAGIEKLLAKLPGSQTAFPTLAADIKGATEQAKWFRDAARLMREETVKVASTIGSTIVPLKQLSDGARSGASAHRDLTKAVAEVIPPSAEELRILGLLDEAHRNQAAALGLETAAYNSAQKAVEKYIKSLPTAKLVGIPGTRDLSGLVPQIGGAAATGGNLAGVGAVGGVVGDTLSAAMAKSFQQIPQLLISAFTGGGGVKGAVSATGTLLGATLGKSIGAGVTALGKFGGPIGEAIGMLAGPLIEKIFGMFGTAGRDTKLQMAASTFGSVEEMQKRLVGLGQAEYDRLWKQFSEVGQNNKGQAVKAIDAITAALDRQKAKQDEVAAASAAQAEAQQAEIDAISGKYTEAIAKLDEEYKSLADSVAKEAAEEFMGITETLERERMEQIRIEKAAKEQERDTAIKTKEEEFAGMLSAGKIVDEELRKVFGKPMEIPYRFVAENEPSRVTAPQSGTGTYTPPSGGSGGGGGSQRIEVPVYLDGEVVTRAVVSTAKRRGLT